jgi:predicted NBD/HSP70 family sugar kinase
MDTCIGIDLAATLIKVAVFENGTGRLVSRTTLPTRDGEEVSKKSVWAAGVARLIEEFENPTRSVGHLGHISIYADGQRDVTGTPGSFEDAIWECTLEDRSEGRFTSTGKSIEAIEVGDRQAEAVWEKAVRDLAAGIASRFFRGNWVIGQGPTARPNWVWTRE